MAQENEKVLSVENLTISFRTDHGVLHAVRNVSFDLAREETLCIVGESGSGKSVTSKAIMGILANNAIIEGGKIMYQGENLLEVSEEEFHRIRGHKIGMIFQDPLSSLNPIVRIGKQITEAMLINSNKLKLMYDEIISYELVQYKNAFAKRNSLIKNEMNSMITFVDQAKAKIKEDKNLSKDEVASLKKEMSEKKKAFKVFKKNKIAEYKEIVAPLKEALVKKQKEAKIEVSKYKKSVLEERKVKVAAELAKLDELKNSCSSGKIDKIELYEKSKSIKLEINKINEESVDKLKITHKEAKRRALEIMAEVGIPMPEKRFKQYPFEFSGGMRQRIVIAIALTASPEILICDEPTTALDVTIQAQILELIKKIQKEKHLSCIFITHDLGVVANMADRIAVMYAGKIVEYGKSEEIFFEPKHPYTWALLSSIPDVDSKERLEAIPGTPPNMIYPPKGDAFALRSRYAMKIDFEKEPPLFKVSDTHYAATWLLHEDAPKVEMPKIVSERIRIALEGKNKKETAKVDKTSSDDKKEEKTKTSTALKTTKKSKTVKEDSSHE